MAKMHFRAMQTHMGTYGRCQLNHIHNRHHMPLFAVKEVNSKHFVPNCVDVMLVQ